MKKRPLVFSIQGWTFILLAVSFPIQIIVKEDLNFNSWGLAFSLLTPLNWATLLTFLILACFSFQARPILKVLLPLSFTLVALNNLMAADILGEKAFSNLMLTIGPATAAYSVFIYYIMFKSNQAYVLENPNLHWWKVAQRFQISFPLWFAQKGQALQRANSFDIATGGLFIPIDVASSQEANYHEGETLQLHLDLLGQVIQCQGRLARIQHRPKGGYPAGLGVQLESLDFTTAHVLKSFLKSLGNYGAVQ